MAAASRRLARLVGHFPGSGHGHQIPAGPGHAAARSNELVVVRVGIYGAGGHTRNAHAPSLRAMPGVEIVAIADPNLKLASALAADFAPGARLYADGAAMLEAEQLDALFSVVPARVRPEGIEAAAARKGVHLFSEKPQTLDMATARTIAEAVAEGGVVSSVGFRERYRPLFRAARDFLADKEVVHCVFRSYAGLPGRASPGPSWWGGFELRGTSYVATGTGEALPTQTYIGGAMLDWGCHAVDYMRYMTGQDIVGAQAWYHHPPEYDAPLAASINFQWGNGGTFQSTFVQSGPAPDRQPWFTIFFVGGCLTVYDYDRVEVNGEVIFHAHEVPRDPAAPADGYVKDGVEYDPWYEQDRCFIEDVRDRLAGRSSSAARLVNDYADGLKTLAPCLAAWDSARRGGVHVDVVEFAASAFAVADASVAARS